MQKYLVDAYTNQKILKWKKNMTKEERKFCSFSLRRLDAASPLALTSLHLQLARIVFKSPFSSEILLPYGVLLVN